MDARIKSAHDERGGGSAGGGRAAELRVRREGGLGWLTLDRPGAINALNWGMIRGLAAALDDWERDDGVRAVLIDGAGERGFCAGGDVRAVWQTLTEGGGDSSAFFQDEYRLNHRIATYPKPIVAVMDGIAMGGGIGIGGHARHRIVTERSVLAMPETAIGFTLDVGGSWLLARAPGQLGTHLALTAGRMTGADAIHCGLADVIIAADRLGELPGRLSGAAAIGPVLAAMASPPPASPLAGQAGWIDAAYAGDSVMAILAALGGRAEPAAAEAAAAIGRNSPLSLTLALAALRRAAAMGSVAEALRQEYRLALYCLGQPDFLEGVRAQVVDKDRRPRWSPSRLEDVGAAALAAAFAMPAGGDLVLPDDSGAAKST